MLLEDAGYGYYAKLNANNQQRLKLNANNQRRRGRGLTTTLIADAP